MIANPFRKSHTVKFHTVTQSVLFALGASLLSLLLYYFRPALLEELDQRGQDIVFRLRDAPAPPEQVAVVTVDEKSIKKYGRWPWSRTLQAQLLQRLKTLGAGVIALDIIYLLTESPEADQMLIDVLAAPGSPVIGGYFFRNERTIGGEEQDLARLRDQRIKLIRCPPGCSLDTVTDFPFVETNQREIGAQFHALGFFNAIHDSDGLIRSTPLVIRHGEDYYPSLLLKALSQYAGLPIGLNAALEGLASVRLGPLSIPVDAEGRLALNFYTVIEDGSPKHLIPMISAADVLDGSVDPALILDRLIFLGVTELGIADVRPTPVDDAFPGVMVHATGAANIINSHYLFRDDRILLINVALMGIVPLLMVLMLTRIRRPHTMAGVFAAILAGMWGIFYWLVAKQSFLVSLVYPALAVAMGFTVFVSYYILTSQRKNRFLTQAFSSYVSPQLVDQLLQDPDRLTLAGEKREITVLFSDLRGFTTISESMSPEKLSEMLNVYLDAMCEVVMQHQGTLDKYIGDAVMAIYNAPLDIENHPLKAAASALAMLEKLKQLNEDFEVKFGIRLVMGVGVNTGPAIVGNLGGARRFDYTAVGDTVNLGSRLEGQTKEYGVDVLISESTRRGLGEHFLCRKIDRIRVKGKKEAVEIYQLMGEAREPGMVALAERFEAALAKYFAGDFTGTEQACMALLKDYPEDSPTRVLLERCRAFLESPPLPEWDGVFVATRK